MNGHELGSMLKGMDEESLASLVVGLAGEAGAERAARVAERQAYGRMTRGNARPEDPIGTFRWCRWWT